MDVILKIFNGFLFIAFIAVHFFILRKIDNSSIRYRLLAYLFIALIYNALFSILFAWWNDESKIVLLDYYHAWIYNPDSGGFQIEYDNVKPENLVIVKNLEKSVMGIGWPLRAIFMFVFSIPLLFVISAINVFYDDRRTKTNIV